MPAPKDPVRREEWLRKNRESHLGKVSPMKGKHHTSESNEKNRKAHLGKAGTFKGMRHSQESIVKNRLAHLGKIASLETREKMSLARQGEKAPFFGKHHTEKSKSLLRDSHIGLKPSTGTLEKMSKSHMGRKQSEETKKLLSDQRKGVPRPQHVRDALLKASIGRQVTHETRQKMSKAGKGRPKSDDWKEQMKELRKNWKIKYTDTKPERMMQIALSLNGIQFEKQKRIHFGNHDYHHVDIFIEPNICVEVDGVHWHTKPENMRRDMYVNQELNILGYHVLRIRDKDILKNAQKPAENVIELIKHLKYGISFNGM